MEVSAPRRICRLDQTVSNQIAAGETIQRPANAVKELLENSIDAKSTSVQITIGLGGLKLIQIQDNGCGIMHEDLEILCERFTTSKLQKFEDLQSIETYGFRGEALSSISCVARVRIVTRTATDDTAWKLSYVSGKPDGKPKRCAGNMGTIIIIEDLFFNLPTRREALRSPAEEFNRIAEVVTRYAINNPYVSINLKKQNESLPYIQTKGGPSVTSLDIIRTVFSEATSRELIALNIHDELFKLSGFVSKTNFSQKKLTFIIFINRRLVDCAVLKRTIETVYTPYLPRNSHPFVYLSLEMNPKHVDVNVHPTKNEVRFLYEDVILQRLRSQLDAILTECNNSRTFFTNAFSKPKKDFNTASQLNESNSNVTKASTSKNRATVESETGAEKKKAAASTTAVYDHQLVRSDSREMSIIESFRGGSQQQAAIDRGRERREIRLASVLRMRDDVNTNSSDTTLIANHSFVGVADSQRVLIQHDTKLYLVNSFTLCAEFYYQIMLREFGNFASYRFSTPILIRDLALLGLDMEESGWRQTDLPKDVLANHTQQHLLKKAEMLQDYFAIRIDSDGYLCGLPVVLPNLHPPLAALPMYVLRIATNVDWDHEQPCFESICRETARFYASQLADTDEHTDLMTHVVFPAMKRNFKVPKDFVQPEKGCFIQVANLPDLYRVFERC